MSKANPIELEIFKNLFHSIAEEMGAALRRTAFSPNIKERRDYSCAVFNADGEAIAMGDHMPVHLGSMPMSVRAAIETLSLLPGDVAMLNDPFCGGTHLPDLTLVAPVFLKKHTPLIALRTLKRAEPSPRQRPEFFVASRAHHADIGGAYAGSMGPCREIYQEGLRIPPVHLVRQGALQRDVLTLLLHNVRTPQEREGDLHAQLAACHTGAERLRELSSRYSLPRAQRAAIALLDYSENMMRAFLARLPRGVYRAEDFLDDDGVSDRPVKICVAIHVASDVGRKSSGKRKPIVTVDFSGSDAQVEGSINAVEAITFSACFYVFRCLLAEDVPATAGLMRPIRVVAPAGSVVNARPPAAVAGGNVETSQRIVDVLLRALAQAVPERIPAGSSGTMNNLTIGGSDPRTGRPFAYYETIAGGMGARPGKDGVSAVHTHMTNSLNTPIEALEYAYPFRVTEYSIRRPVEATKRVRRPEANVYRGGKGIVREIELLTDADVTVLADRRKRGPYGLGGAPDGQPGKTFIVHRDGLREELPGKVSRRLRQGEHIRIESPGGGSWAEGGVRSRK